MFTALQAVLRSAGASASASASPTELPLASAAAAAASDPPAAPTDFWDALQEWQKNTFSLGFAGTIIYTLIVAGIAFIVMQILKRTAGERLTGTMHIFYRLLQILVVVVAVTAVLTTITPLKDLGNAIVASSGIASVIVGLAAQESLGNVFSGISISVAKPFVVGEYIELLGTTPVIAGTVQAITLRHTILLDANNKNIVVPNSVIDGDIIKRSPQHAERSDADSSVNNFLDVGVAYDADIDKAIEIMQKLVAEQPEYVDQRTKKEKEEGAPAVTVRVQELAESSVNLRAWVWTANVGDGFKALSDLRLAVLKSFNANGIEIPYPYRNIILRHDDSGEEQSAPDKEKVLAAVTAAPEKKSAS